MAGEANQQINKSINQNVYPFHIIIAQLAGNHTGFMACHPLCDNSV
jgi:hypothetical protein